MNLKEIKKNSKVIHKGKIFDLYQDQVVLPNGATGVREYIKHPGGASVLAIKANNVYLIEQFRYAYNKTMLEIPAGKLEIGEDPQIAALRELKEETGLVAKDLKLLTKIYPTVGYTDEIIYVYLAQDFEEHSQNLDADEFINIVKIPYKDALNMVLKGEVCDAKTQVALLMYNTLIEKSI